ncbi:hypothetical protein ACFE04_023049 [Oxalis oulophora]
MHDNKRKRRSSIDDDNHEVFNNIKRKMKMKMKMMNRMRLSTILFVRGKMEIKRHNVIRRRRSSVHTPKQQPPPPPPSQPQPKSQQNVGECIRLSKEIRLLPPGHQAKEDKLEVKKMVLYAINEALKDLGHNTEKSDFSFGCFICMIFILPVIKMLFPASDFPHAVHSEDRTQVQTTGLSHLVESIFPLPWSQMLSIRIPTQLFSDQSYKITLDADSLYRKPWLMLALS